MKTVGLVVSNIFGLAGFGNRMQVALGERAIAVVGLGSSRYDVHSEAEPCCRVEYLPGELFRPEPPSLTPSERAYTEAHLDRSMLWPDADRYMASAMRLPPPFRWDDIGEPLSPPVGRPPVAHPSAAPLPHDAVAAEFRATSSDGRLLQHER